jgi:hypothetical protein
MDHRRGNRDGTLAPSANDADECSLNLAVDDRAVYEERLEFLGLGWSLANLQQNVGGLIDVVAHREGDFWINDEGRINGSPVNVRVTNWVLNDSALAKQGRAGEWSVIFGDVVITGGPDREGESSSRT